MSGPSEKAVEAASQRMTMLFHGPWPSHVQETLAAAHAPALGLDRSVCLRDVVERISHCADVVDPDGVSGTALTLQKIAAVLEHEFGGGS